ncbi:hypothetical protein KEM56_000142 [Ascosphaera pollenicola]|nr:hypothetical protein KEM56_000142 [Ascosphaera pollenicola]
MSNAAVFERRNKQIQDAINGGSLKQALQLCEKRIKKGESSHFLLAWRANILCAHKDAASKERGINETLELCRAEPPVSDLDTIELLCENLRLDNEHKSTIHTLWERAAKVKPQDFEIQYRWFYNAMEAGDWKVAQKAAMSLQHNFPNERSYYFWAIFLCYLITIDRKSTEADRRLFGALAYRMIQKAASIASAHTTTPPAPRAIQNSEELLLLVKILETQGRFVEIADTLNGKALGTESKVVQGDWTFTQERLRSLKKAKLWEELLRSAKNLLALPDGDAKDLSFDPEERDDWEVWQGLLRATREQLTQMFKSSLEFVTEYIGKRPKSRNARLCLLNLVELGVQKGQLPPSELVQHCQRYFDENGHKLYCFFDLREVMSSMDLDDRKEVIRHLSEKSLVDTKVGYYFDGIVAINTLKLKYCFRLSFDKSSPEEVENFVVSCLTLYRSLEKPVKGDGVIESQPRDDLCIMASMALIKLHQQNSTSSSNQTPKPILIQAAVILEHVLVGSPHNYEALLLLTRFYMLLGAGSLALNTFAKLNVKQVQYESVAHNLFTRLATIHPHPAPQTEGLEPRHYDLQFGFRVALNFYLRSVATTTKAALHGLECGSYVNAQGSLKLQDKLKRSICRRMWALEERRVQRLLGGSPSTLSDHIVYDAEEVTDQRNFEGFMNLEAPGQPTFEEYVRVGPLIGAKGLKALSLVDTVFYLLTGPKVSPNGKKPQPDIQSFSGFERDLPKEELTPAEIEHARIYSILLKGATGLSNGQNGAADVQAAIKKASEWVKLKSSQLTQDYYVRANGIRLSGVTAVPSWIYLHSNITCVETLMAINIFVKRVSHSKAAHVPKEELEALASSVSLALENIRTNTKALKSQVIKPGVLSELISACLAGGDTLQAKIGELIDEATLESFAGSLIESWEEALDGVNSVAMF